MVKGFLILIKLFMKNYSKINVIMGTQIDRTNDKDN